MHFIYKNKNTFQLFILRLYYLNYIQFFILIFYTSYLIIINKIQYKKLKFIKWNFLALVVDLSQLPKQIQKYKDTTNQEWQLMIKSLNKNLSTWKKGTVKFQSSAYRISKEEIAFKIKLILCLSYWTALRVSY